MQPGINNHISFTNPLNLSSLLSLGRRQSESSAPQIALRRGGGRSEVPMCLGALANNFSLFPLLRRRHTFFLHYAHGTSNPTTSDVYTPDHCLSSDRPYPRGGGVGAGPIFGPSDRPPPGGGGCLGAPGKIFALFFPSAPEARKIFGGIFSEMSDPTPGGGGAWVGPGWVGGSGLGGPPPPPGSLSNGLVHSSTLFPPKLKAFMAILTCFCW